MGPACRRASDVGEGSPSPWDHLTYTPNKPHQRRPIFPSYLDTTGFLHRVSLDLRLSGQEGRLLLWASPLNR